MIRVCVVDDEPMARNGVLARLAPHSDMEVVGEYGDGPSALTGLLATSPDLVFMDVQMPGINGLDALAAIPIEKRPLSVLLTAHEGFAVRAFSLSAIDYLLKPIDDQRFLESLDRVRELIQLRGLRAKEATAARVPPELNFVERFSVRIGHRLVYVRPGDVEWIGADGDYAVLHVRNKTYMVRESLQHLASRLDAERFIRVHRSSIVRIDQIAELRPLTNRDAIVRLVDGTPLRVSRTYMGNLLAKLHQTHA